MNILFAMYGSLRGNSAYPMALHARELSARGHSCVVAVPSAADAEHDLVEACFTTVTHQEALAKAETLFPDRRPADILHAWTPREGVRRFATSYLSRRATPLLVCLEDNEAWIGRESLSLVGIGRDVLHQHTHDVISTWTPDGMPHVLQYPSFVGLADAAVVVQEKLRVDVPPWVPWSTVMLGVDLQYFSPRPPDPLLRARIGIAENEHVIVHPSGLNDFTRPGIESLCRTVGLINEAGIPCRLVRTGPGALDFMERLPESAARAVLDLGVVPRTDVPSLMSLSELFVQPGRPDAFEELRLPGKLPEFFAMGRPVVMLDANIATLVRDGVDALLHRTGNPEEIAQLCISLFKDPERARRLGAEGRRFAETHFDPARQAELLLRAYETAIDAFDAFISTEVWRDAEGQIPSLLEARKLRSIARRDHGQDAWRSAMLEAYARQIELGYERARGLEEGMAVRDRQIAALQASIAAAGKDAASAADGRADRLAELERTLATTSEALAAREAEIAAIRASLSWRLMRPLRAMADWIARLSGH